MAGIYAVGIKCFSLYDANEAPTVLETLHIHAECK